MAAEFRALAEGDRLVGTDGSQNIHEFSGNDVILGRGGADFAAGDRFPADGQRKHSRISCGGTDAQCPGKNESDGGSGAHPIAFRRKRADFAVAPGRICAAASMSDDLRITRTEGLRLVP